MGGGKPPVPENMRGTLIPSGSYFMHTSTFTILLYKPCAMAISKYSEPAYLRNYAFVVVFELDLHRTSFYNEIDFFFYSTTAKLLPL